MVAEDYFCPIALGVFSDTLTDLGASRAESTAHSVRFKSANWFVDLLVLPEDGPRYCPRVEIGPLPELGVLSRNCRVDIMHTVPGGSPLRNYNLHWIYTEAEAMKAAFVRVRDEIFVPYAVPVLQNQSELVSLVKARSKIIEEQWQEQITAHNSSINHGRAEIAFREKNFSGYLAWMAKIPAERLTKVDLARIEYARSRS